MASGERKLTLYSYGKKVKEIEVQQWKNGKNMERFWQRWRERFIEEYGIDPDDVEIGNKI